MDKMLKAKWSYLEGICNEKAYELEGDGQEAIYCQVVVVPWYDGRRHLLMNCGWDEHMADKSRVQGLRALIQYVKTANTKM